MTINNINKLCKNFNEKLAETNLRLSKKPLNKLYSFYYEGRCHCALTSYNTIGCKSLIFVCH